jgi:hypothetical protein
MQVRVMEQVRPPTVEDGEEANLGTQMLGIRHARSRLSATPILPLPVTMIQSSFQTPLHSAVADMLRRGKRGCNSVFRDHNADRQMQNTA